MSLGEEQSSGVEQIGATKLERIIALIGAVREQHGKAMQGIKGISDAH